eukprot:scaffold102307_cov21-Tisochrysis_lutea.AAC.2
MCPTSTPFQHHLPCPKDAYLYCPSAHAECTLLKGPLVPKAYLYCPSAHAKCSQVEGTPCPKSLSLLPISTP